MSSPTRGEYLFRLLSSIPVFNTLDFVGINNDASVTFKKGASDVRVKMAQAEGGCWVFDAWMSEGGSETVSQRSYGLGEVAAFVEDAYAYVKTTTI